MKNGVANLVRTADNAPDEIGSNESEPPFDEERFRQIYFYELPEQKTFASRLKKVKCSCRWLLRVFPILQWLPEYKKKDIGDDIISGLTVAVMHIPQGMAYALLGGVPPVVGIYMAFFPVLVYILMGTSKHISMGSFAVVCMMVGKSVDAYSHHSEEEGPSPIEVAAAVCFVVGIWQVILSVLRLGSLSVLLSETLVSGFTTGAAVHVLTSQIKNLLGIEVRKHSGPFKVVYSYIDIFRNVSNLNMTATALSVSFITFLFTFNQFIKPYLQKKLKRALPVPVEFIAVIVGTLLSQQLSMHENYDLAVINFVPKGLPQPSLPALHLLPVLVMDGLVIAIVSVSVNISMASIFAQKLGYEIDGNQELLASGMGNVFSSFFSCMPFSASLSRSLIQQTVGGKTQLASLVSCVALVIILLFVGPFFEPLPYCVLSSIIVVALKGMLMQLGEVPRIARNSRMDGFVWASTFAGVVVLDIDYGLGIGLMASITTLLLRGQRTEVVVLGRIPNSEIYVDANRYRKAQPVSNTLILQVIGGLHFANSAEVKKKIMESFVKFRKELFVGVLITEKLNRSLYLIVDLSCVPFIDPSAVKTLRTIYDSVNAMQSNFLLSGCAPSVYDFLHKSEHLEGEKKPGIFHSVQDAVEHVKALVGTNEFLARF